MSKTPLKIAIGSRLRSGPWGGSNQFLVSLVTYLKQQGVEIFFDLAEPELDIILLTDPRRKGMSWTFRHEEIIRYFLRKNWKAIVVHRINECDERKGSTDVNAQLMTANFCADHTVFISHWLRDLFLRHGLKVKSSSSVILNGADHQIFHSNDHHYWEHSGKLRMVTHHWGGNWMKGFDIYERVDQLLAHPSFKEKIAFTYIGNLPEGFQFQYATYLPGQSGIELADSLRRHHVYLTASQNEPAGMHHIEGAMCGLPLLYRESGALPDYCNGFGISFTTDNFEQKLQEMLNTYGVWVERMNTYPYNAEYMCKNYYKLFIRLINERGKLLRRRILKQKPMIWLMKAAWRRAQRPFRRLKKKIKKL